jgi:hypothetical protein
MSLMEAEFSLLWIVTMFRLMEVLILKQKLDRVAPQLMKKTDMELSVLIIPPKAYMYYSGIVSNRLNHQKAWWCKSPGHGKNLGCDIQSVRSGL